MSASPAAAKALTRANMEIDVRHVLPSIRVPTLILHATGDQTFEVGHGRYLAAQIRDARLVEIDSDDHLPWLSGSDQILANVQEFLTGVRPVLVSDRILCTIMFTDIVDSTKIAAEIGDHDWKALLDDHNAVVRRSLSAFNGREINAMGDGFVAIFDGPARAIQCAMAVEDSIEKIGLGIRIGLHTGECEVDNGSLSGLALHIASRIPALASTSEILASRTVKDLVAGSGIGFEDFGVHALKGVPDPWQIHRVAS